MRFNNSNLPRSAQIPPWRLQAVGKTWRNAHRSLEGLRIASFHFSQHPGAVFKTKLVVCLDFLCFVHRISLKMMHVTSVVVFVHLLSGSLFLDQKQTFKPCVPKNDIIKPCTKKKTKFTNSFNSKGCPTPRLEHSPWAPFTGQMCQIRWFPEKKQWNYGLWGFTMLTPSSQTAISQVFFAPAKAALRLLHANHLPVQLSPGAFSRHLTRTKVTQKYCNSTSKSTWSNDPSRSPHGYPLPPLPLSSISSKSNMMGIQVIQSKKRHERIVNFEGNWRYCFASGFLRV